MVPQTVIGVMAYNEEANIAACLRAIFDQLPEVPFITSVVVVASGCTDRTVEIVRLIARDDSRLRLFVEERRSGKAAAINLFLSQTSEPICVIVSGDVILNRGSLAKLLEPFANPSIGMTGGRPVPTNPRESLTQNMVHVYWSLHHELGLQKPKLGEAVAFRRVVPQICPQTLCDETSLEQTVVAHGLHLQYVPDAIVWNRGAEIFSDFIRRRVTNHRGHLALASRTGYRASSVSFRNSVGAAWRLWRHRQASLRYIVAAGVTETVARAYARATIAAGWREDGVWRRIRTSSGVLEAEPNPTPESQLVL